MAPLSSVMAQSVVISSGLKPASPSTKLSFMLKHPAWAAAMSSSGFVPTPSANRELKEYWVLFRVVLCVVSTPFPSLPDPFQTAVAFLFMACCYKFLLIGTSYDLFGQR